MYFLCKNSLGIFTFSFLIFKPLHIRKLVTFLFLILLACSKDAMETVIDPVEQFTLSVSSSQGGSVNNEGGTFNSGTRVTITATPNEGFEFTGWSDSSYGDTNPLTINLTSNTNITANFQPIRYTLTVNVVGQGQVSQVLGNESNTSTTVEYNQGDRVRLQTTPGDDWTFSRWQGDATGYEDTVEIVMDGSKTITATFDFEVLDDLVGAWDIASDSSSDKKIVKAPESGKDVICGFYALIFNPDYSFTLYYSLGTIRGEFTIEDPTTISLIGYGSITEISFTAQGVSFNLVLDTGCSSDITGEKDEEYDPEEPPKSFLERVDGSYWKMTSEDESYSKILAFRDNLPEEFGDMHDIDEVNQCISQVTNFNEFVEVVENYNDQLIYRYTYYEENEMEGTMSLRSDGSMQFSENYEDDSQDRIFTYYEITPEEFEQAIAIENCEDIDITAPVITLANASNQETTTVVVPLGEDYVEPGYTANDDVDGDITQSVIIEGEIDTSTVGTYILNYFVEDSSGNIASTSREIIVQEVEYLVYFENGTCKCPNATVGETATISGTTYTVVDNSTIQGEVNNGNVNLCTSLVTNMSLLFSDKSNFNEDISFWDTSNTQSMFATFANASSFNQDIGNWNTSNVTTTRSMFFGASSFNKDIGNWNVASVETMYQMFKGASTFDQPIGNWDTSEVTNMSRMFESAGSFNQDIGGWNTSNVTNMSMMFERATDFNQTIGNWDTSNVLDMNRMFFVASSFNQPIKNWNVANVTNMGNMFNASEVFNHDISNWDVSNVTSMAAMFTNAVSFNQPIGSWDTSGVTDMQMMFYNASSFDQPIGNWDVSNVQQMSYMFKGAERFNQDLSSWCVTGIQTEPMDFSVNSPLTNSNKPVWGTCPESNSIDQTPPIITLNGANPTFLNQGENWTDPGATATDDVDGDLTSSISITGTVDASTVGTYTLTYSVSDAASNAASTTRTVIVNQAVTSSIYFENGTCKCPNASTGDTAMIDGVTYAVVDNSSIRAQIENENYNLCTSQVTDMSGLFKNKTDFNSNISFWDTSNVTTMSEMFDNASSFNQDIGNWDVSSVTNMFEMFENTTSFNQDIGEWNTSNVVNMRGLFAGASTFNQNIGGWDTFNVENMYAVFLDATAFNQNIENWDTSSTTNMGFMFSGASVFNQNIGSWDTSLVTNMEAMFQVANAFNKDIGNWNVGNVTSMNVMFYGAGQFNQDLSSWCVENINSLPENFVGVNSVLDSSNYPVWGTCPADCTITYSQNATSFTTTETTQNFSPSNTVFTLDEICTENDPYLEYVDGLPNGLDVDLIYFQDGINPPYWYGVVTGTAEEGTQGTYNVELAVSNAVPSDGINPFTPGTTSTTISFNLVVNAIPPSNIYFENGTCKCPNATVGETATISGTTYTVVDTSSIYEEVQSNGNINLCTTKVDSMMGLFQDNQTFNQDISFWDVSNVTDMHYMFKGASSFNQDISNWDTSSVTNMNLMFAEATSFNKPVGDWDTSNVSSMGGMFFVAVSFNQTIGNWDVSNVTDMGGMFGRAESFNQDISNWNVSKLENMNGMFSNTVVFNQDLSNWDVSNVVRMGDTFRGAHAFNQPIGSWDTSKVTTMEFMFSDTQAFNQDIGNWDVSNVENMNQMFASASAFDQDLTGWCVTNINPEPENFTNEESILAESNKPIWGTCPADCTITYSQDATSFTTTETTQNFSPSNTVFTLDEICTENDPYLEYVDGLPNGLDVDLIYFQDGINPPYWYGVVTGTAEEGTQGTYNVELAVSNAVPSDGINPFTPGTTSTTISFNLVVNAIPPSNIYFENGTCKCPNATVGDTEVIDGVTYTVVDNSTIENEIESGNIKLCTSKVTSLSMLFYENTSFNSDISFWDVSNVISMMYMFQGASLFNQNIDNWDVSSVTRMDALFRDASSFNQPLNNWDVSSVTDMMTMFKGASSFNQDLSNWIFNEDNENLNFMFDGATSFNGDISNWDVSNVKKMPGMFMNASSFNQDLSNWETSSVESMSQMFYGANSFNQNISNWDISSLGIPGLNSMFMNATSFDQNLSGWCVNQWESRPSNFDTNSGLSSENKPIWGTCPDYNIKVTASSSSDYTLSGSDRNGTVTGNDPSITINVGDEINFIVDAASHPFYIKTAQGIGTENLATNVNNNGATSGVVNWTPTTAGTYYYQCSVHNGMYGVITVQ